MIEPAASTRSDPGEAVCIVQMPLQGHWTEVSRQLADVWGEDAMVYRYLEALDACVLERVALSACTPPATAFEGRLFGGNHEFRWLVSRGELRGWLLSEHTAEEYEALRGRHCGRVLRVERLDRRYYLLGSGGDPGSGGVFRDARYGSRAFSYPVPALDRAGRAYVSVAEYRRSEPDWSAAMTEQDTSTWLNASLLVAHRFVSVAATTIGDEEAD